MDRRRARLAILACGLLAACASPAPSGPSAELRPAPDADWGKARPVMVRLADFSFTPNHIALEAGAPVRLTLVNAGSGAHDFFAPRFFATVGFRQGTVVPDKNGSVTLKAGETEDIELVPTQAGTYPLECTEFLHSLFGMTGVIEVTNRS
ncbi:MAG TPA: cupredoxin domain-containing protein [Aliidongia sp.]|nr:cupredoxin domain-containing protein [Aliidongia sp.]